MIVVMHVQKLVAHVPDSNAAAWSRNTQYGCVRSERFSTRHPPYFANQRRGRRASQLSMASRNRESMSSVHRAVGSRLLGIRFNMRR